MFGMAKYSSEKDMAETPSNAIQVLENTAAFELLNQKSVAKTAAFIFAGIFLMFIPILFIPWQQNIMGTGTVTAFHPKNRPQTINSAIGGRIEDWYVAEGNTVAKGEPILRISDVKTEYFDPEYIERLSEQLTAKTLAVTAYENKIRALDRQLVSLESNMEIALESSQNKADQQRLFVRIDSANFVAAKNQFDIADIQFKRQQNLVAQGLKAQADLEQYSVKFQDSYAKLEAARNKWEVTQSLLVNALLEINSLQGEYLQKIAKTESDMRTAQADMNEAQISVSKLRNDLANLEVRTGLYIVRAPQDGIVVRALNAGIGEVIKEGEPVVTILPENPELSAEIYYSAVDAPLLHKGMEVFIQFDGWPALQFSGWPEYSIGVFRGEVAVVDYVNSGGGKFRVLVNPLDGIEWPHQLRVGTGVYAWAMLNEVPLWYEIWRQLNGFPPDFYKQNAADGVSSSVGGGSGGGSKSGGGSNSGGKK